VTLAHARGRELSATALALVALDALVRLVVGEPYPGATWLLLAACGFSLTPFLPRQLGLASVRVALFPSLAIGSFSILLTTVSVTGIALTELSIRIAVAALVVGLGAVALRTAPPTGASPRTALPRRDGLALLALAGIFALSFASAWDVLEPFPPPGSDWAYYQLYADEVASQHALLADDPYAGEDERLFSTQPGVGAVYGSLRLLDGVSADSLSRGLAVASALTPVAAYGAVGGLWGAGAGLAAAAVYAVAPIRLEPLYWHGLATTLALLFVWNVLLALGFLYRGGRDRRTIALLGFSLASLAAVHSASAAVIAVWIAAVLVAELVRGALRRGSPRASWREDMSRPVLAGLGAALVLGAGVIAHLRRQAVDLGSPVSYLAFDRHWLTGEVLRGYYSWTFLALVAACLLLVAGRATRRDPALSAVATLALSAVLVSQLWRVHVAFEYRRVVYYLALAMVALVGAAATGLRARRAWVPALALVLLYLIHGSIGFRLPERLLSDREPRSQLTDALESFKGRLGGRETLVADRCLGARVPYVVRQPTLIALEDWQVGFQNLRPVARDAAAILRGGTAGRRLAARLGVRYVLVDPRCTPDVGRALRARTVLRSDDLVVVALPAV
jgi:hypothetical protein